MKSTAEQRGWYWYDWANSAFYTTGHHGSAGPYLTELTTNAADANGLVHPLGIPVYAKSYWSYLISLSVGLQVLFLPVVARSRITAVARKKFRARQRTSAHWRRARCFFCRGRLTLWEARYF
jgi:UMF1 family MFS transporter